METNANNEEPLHLSSKTDKKEKLRDELELQFKRANAKNRKFLDSTQNYKDAFNDKLGASVKATKRTRKTSERSSETGFKSSSQTKKIHFRKNQT